MRVCRKKRALKSTFAKKSFRWGEWESCKHGECRHLYACPKGEWQPRKKICRTSMMIYETFVRSTRPRCPKGYRKSTKKGV